MLARIIFQVATHADHVTHGTTIVRKARDHQGDVNCVAQSRFDLPPFLLNMQLAPCGFNPSVPLFPPRQQAAALRCLRLYGRLRQLARVGAWAPERQAQHEAP